MELFWFCWAARLALAWACCILPAIFPDPINPVPPVPPDPVNPDDPSWPPSEIALYTADIWGQVEVGMTRGEVLALMPSYWKRIVVEGKRSFVYVTDEAHENGFPKLFTVRYPIEPDDDSAEVIETSGKPY